ncbi:hypothetical protein ES703_123700 [subsurface metagenome]
MTEELAVTEERGDKGKVISSFTILKCKTEVIETPDGKRHFESVCQDKKARDELAAVFEEEAVLRVNPKVVLDDTPPVEPPAPDTRFNPTES